MWDGRVDGLREQEAMPLIEGGRLEAGSMSGTYSCPRIPSKTNRMGTQDTTASVAHEKAAWMQAPHGGVPDFPAGYMAVWHGNEWE